MQDIIQQLEEKRDKARLGGGEPRIEGMATVRDEENADSYVRSSRAIYPRYLRG